METWLRFIAAILAAWRITHLLAHEDGPADVVVRIRKRLGNGFLGSLMDCFQCLSIWVAAAVAGFVTTRPLDLLICWLAVSGAACLLQRLGREPLTIHPMPEPTEGDVNHALLWTETGASHEFSNANGAAPQLAARSH
ncbi:MAG TPA: DUF1360 domain-containing protein [Candidatus Acidoferrales bacterium]|jgi:hypothetical protein|nr:DUF1360 domain-containing protein [Candidatus Acidoferrales bacterium]